MFISPILLLFISLLGTYIVYTFVCGVCMGAYGIENTKLCIKQAGMTIKWRAVTLEKYRNPE